MKEFLSKIDYYISQYDIEKQLYRKGQEIKTRGWLNKDEFLIICLWKSRRKKKDYNLNSQKEVQYQTKQAFAATDERLKIQYLSKLKGVGIPTASAILSVTNPDNYPIIDKRCVEALNNLGLIDWENISVGNWVKYLKIIRVLAKKNNKSPREFEKGLFAYNRITLDKEFRNLYK